MAYSLIARQTAGTDSSALEFPSLDGTYGAYVIGTFVGTILYGFSVHQTYNYTQRFSADALYIRYLVYAVMTIETVHTAFTMHTCYYYLISHYFQPDVLDMGVWSINWIPVLLGVNMIFSQLFFARRVYLMGRFYRIVVVFALLFFAVEIGFAIASVREVIVITTFDSIIKVDHLLAGTFGAAIVGDTLLTGSLIKVLYQSRKSEEYKLNKSWFETITIYVINTGLLHGLMNITSLVVLLCLPSDLIHASISIVTTRIYGNTLLAVLNSRKLNISRGIEIIEGGELGMNIISRANRLAAQERWNVPQVPDEVPSMINIQVTTEMGEDKYDSKSLHGVTRVERAKSARLSRGYRAM